MIRPANDKPLKGGLGGGPGSSGPLIPSSFGPTQPNGNPQTGHPSSEQPQFEIDERTPAKDFKLISAMIRRGGFPFPDGIPQAIANQAALFALSEKKSDRVRMSATRTSMQMIMHNDRIELERLRLELAIKQSEQPSITINNINANNNNNSTASIAGRVEDLLGEPEYLEFLERKATSDAGIVCNGSKPGQVSDTPAHNGNIESNNGYNYRANGTHTAN